MTNLHPDDDIYPVRVCVDRNWWPVVWQYKGRRGRYEQGPRQAMTQAMEHAKKILVPGTEVLLRADGSVMHGVVPPDPDYVPAD